MNSDRLVNLFIEIAKINALSGEEKSLADFIKLFLSKYNYIFFEDETWSISNSNSGNLICKIGDGGEFVLSSHMDTARPTSNVIPIIKDGKISSSGDTVLGVDNRAGIAVLLFVLEKIAKDNVHCKDFTVAFTTCEETTLLGSKHIGLNGNIKYGYVFDSAYRPGNFIYSACGALSFKIKVIGKASHSGLSPEKGINALQIAARAISNLPLGRIDDETTMNIGIFNSGTALNVIPELALVQGEIRSFDKSKMETYFKLCIQTFQKITSDLGGDIESEFSWDFKPYTILDKSKVIQEIIRVLNKIGLTPIPRVSLGGSDANSFNERGIESINLGIGAQNPHSNDEFIFIDDLVNSAEIALELVKK